MKNRLMKARLVLLAVAFCLIPSWGQAEPIDTTGYVVDSRNEIVKSGFGLCWRTSYWTPAMAIAECDPDLVKKEGPPAPIAKPVKAAPVPAPAPLPKPAAAKVTLAADTLFDFDKALLHSEGKAALDKVVDTIKDSTLEVINAVGHADRVEASSKQHAQELSERRAESVKAYLVAKGIEPLRVNTKGKGNKQPVTKPKECKGPKSKKVIACLQPDRRVEIEVIGVRGQASKLPIQCMASCDQAGDGCQISAESRGQDCLDTGASTLICEAKRSDTSFRCDAEVTSCKAHCAQATH